VAKAQGSSVVVGFCFFGLLGSMFAWAVLRVLVFVFFLIFPFCLVSFCILLVFFRGALRFL
jgi:hypothetical protein